MIRCNHCGATNLKSAKQCRRCSLSVKLDRAVSLQKSIAFLIASILFYIPANLYPILKSSQFGNVQGSTIIEGVLQMWHHGDYPVAAIIFIASVLVPLAKFAILFYLIAAIALQRCSRIDQKVRLYYLIEITGPWSLIDVFVVVLLAALIHFSNVAIIPGIGVTSFALMVFLTILSARSLDVRLLGENCE